MGRDFHTNRSLRNSLDGESDESEVTYLLKGAIKRSNFEPGELATLTPRQLDAMLGVIEDKRRELLVLADLFSERGGVRKSVFRAGHLLKGLTLSPLMMLGLKDIHDPEFSTPEATSEGTYFDSVLQALSSQIRLEIGRRPSPSLSATA